MSGIYIHIPFCKRRCIYCDFYSTTRSELRNDYIDALDHELELRHNYLNDTHIHTLYIGGGTPSQLSKANLDSIFNTLYKVYDMSDCKEITIECNPDDLTTDYIETLHTLPINRLSIGIQTFNESMLKLLCRRHTARQAITVVKECQDKGFENISIDLMYGLPHEDNALWKNDLEQALSLNVPHISAYHLIYEEGTPLWTMLQKKQIKEVDEETSVNLFSELINSLTENGYNHYEISNFCKPGMHSRHNTNYWNGTEYMGCGPSAHSFNGNSRQWNVASLDEYISSIEKGTLKYEIENLDIPTRYNERIITALRTQWGLSLTQLKQEFGEKYYEFCMEAASPYIKQGFIEIKKDTMKLTQQGIFISDGIMSDLLFIS